MATVLITQGGQPAVPHAKNKQQARLLFKQHNRQGNDNSPAVV
jgi:hypothetical protein